MTDALDRVRERARARKRREAAKERGRKHVEAARARARKIVEAARARARTWLAAANQPRVRVVVKEAKPSAKRRTKAPWLPKAKGTRRPMPKAKPTSPIEQAATFRKALGAVSAENPPGALLSVREVRERAGLPKAVFDALALSFASKNLIVLHHHDFPSSLPAAERAQLVEDGKGTFYIGIAQRRPEPAPVDPIEPASKLLTKAKLYGAGAPVRIASLRKDVSMSPEQFDLAIERLQRLGKVALYRDDNRVTARDEGAYFAAGEPRHILYVKG